MSPDDTIKVLVAQMRVACQTGHFIQWLGHEWPPVDEREERYSLPPRRGLTKRSTA